MCAAAMLAPRLLKRSRLVRRAIARLRSQTAIDRIASWVEQERPDLRQASAPDGTVTLLFSNIENSSRLTERYGDERWLELLRVHNTIVRAQVDEHRGYEVKSRGDGFTFAFPAARQAVVCAIDALASVVNPVAKDQRGIPSQRGVPATYSAYWSPKRSSRCLSSSWIIRGRMSQSAFAKASAWAECAAIASPLSCRSQPMIWGWRLMRKTPSVTRRSLLGARRQGEGAKRPEPAEVQRETGDEQAATGECGGQRQWPSAAACGVDNERSVAKVRAPDGERRRGRQLVVIAVFAPTALECPRGDRHGEDVAGAPHAPGGRCCCAASRTRDQCRQQSSAQPSPPPTATGSGAGLASSGLPVDCSGG
jgi:Adenylate and Guanylate cyclase catalytic domain